MKTNNSNLSIWRPRALFFQEAIAYNSCRIKSSELKTVTLSRSALENLVNKDDATIFNNIMMKIVTFLSYLVYSTSLIRELKQQRRRRLRKRHLKSVKNSTLSQWFQAVQFVKCRQLFLELNSKRLFQSSGKEIESRCLFFTSSSKREIRHFHVEVVQRRQRNVQKNLIHVQSCCFANLNLLLFAVLVAVAVVVAKLKSSL